MNTFEISCQVCEDLIPLVRDGVASEDSTRLVISHTSSCDSCRQLLEADGFRITEKPLPLPDDRRILSRMKKRFYLLGLFLLAFGIGLGIFFTNSAGMFYNFAIMPVSGAMGYVLLRKKWWFLPLGIFILTFLFTAVSLLLAGEGPVLLSGFLYGGVYSVLCLIGSGVSALLCYAFGKEETL